MDEQSSTTGFVWPCHSFGGRSERNQSKLHTTAGQTSRSKNEEQIAEKPKKRGRKVATSRPDKKENANIGNNKVEENVEEKQDANDSEIKSADAKPKREKRPRIGKRTDVVKTTINNDDETNKVQHVSYEKKKKVAEKEETVVEDITAATEVVEFVEETAAVIEETAAVYETIVQETETTTETVPTPNMEEQNRYRREEIVSEFDAVVNAEGVLEIMPDLICTVLQISVRTKDNEMN